MRVGARRRDDAERLAGKAQPDGNTALKAAGKKFEYKIYENAPGGHEFGRLDTKLAKESRHDVYKFLAQYLQPSAR